jgi:hypothetical protein
VLSRSGDCKIVSAIVSEETLDVVLNANRSDQANNKEDLDLGIQDEKVMRMSTFLDIVDGA